MTYKVLENGGGEMKIEIDGSSKEIAALVVELQEQRVRTFAQEFANQINQSIQDRTESSPPFQ